MLADNATLDLNSSSASLNLPVHDKKINRAFKRFDKNGDGIIQHSEVTQVLRNISRDQFNEKAIKKIIDSLDANGDGMIKLSEFSAWASTERGAEVVDIALSTSGPAKFYYDKKHYTGVCAHGGPSVDDRNKVELAHMTRCNLNQGLTVMKVGHEKEQLLPCLASIEKEAEHSTSKLDSMPQAKILPRGPERLFYDKSSYTGTSALALSDSSRTLAEPLQRKPRRLASLQPAKNRPDLVRTPRQPSEPRAASSFKRSSRKI